MPQFCYGEQTAGASGWDRRGEARQAGRCWAVLGEIMVAQVRAAAERLRAQMWFRAEFGRAS